MASTGNAAPPEGYRSVTPYLAVDGAARAIGFYAEAFGARERMRLDAPGGKIGHAELEIGDSVVMLADPWPGGAFEAPRGESASVSIHIYVSDADAVFARALAAGATAIRPVETPFTATAAAPCATPSGTTGTWRRGWKTCRRRRSGGGWRRRPGRADRALGWAGGRFVPCRPAFRLPYHFNFRRLAGRRQARFGRRLGVAFWPPSARHIPAGGSPVGPGWVRGATALSFVYQNDGGLAGARS